jgi:aminoglycoside 6-adenylyltransferase
LKGLSLLSNSCQTIDIHTLSESSLQNAFLTWAIQQSDIRSAIVVGSQARHENPADEWSDLDFVVFANNPTFYAVNIDWLSEIGKVWLSVLGQTGKGDPEWLVLFANGRKADFVLAQANGTLAQTLLNSPYKQVFERGVRVLFDKDDSQAAEHLPGYTAVPLSPPTLSEFTQTIYQTFLITTRTAKFLRRGDLWRAKQVSDGSMRQLLLCMMEWHAQVIHGKDTWYDGRFLEQWADPRVLVVLPTIFSAYDTPSTWDSLLAILDLFRWLAQETAEKLHYPYPETADSHITTFIRHLYLTK